MAQGIGEDAPGRWSFATADVYEEIEQQLAAEVADVIDADREELREARQLADQKY